MRKPDDEDDEEKPGEPRPKRPKPRKPKRRPIWQSWVSAKALLLHQDMKKTYEESNDTKGKEGINERRGSRQAKARQAAAKRQTRQTSKMTAW